MNYFFPQNDSDIYIYIICRKHINNFVSKSNTLIEYEVLSSQYQNYLSSINFYTSASLQKVDINPKFLEVLSKIEEIDDESIEVLKIQLTESEINNGSGILEIEYLFDTFLTLNGDGIYYIQYFFMDDSAKKLVSLPSDIFIFNKQSEEIVNPES